MTPQIKPNRTACLITALAIVYEYPVDRLIEFVGHDGLDNWWPEYAPPRCYRGHHIQELVIALVKLGHRPIVIERFPESISVVESDAKLIADVKQLDKIFTNAITNVPSVLLLSNPFHAVAHANGLIINPDDGKLVEASHISDRVVGAILCY